MAVSNSGMRVVAVVVSGTNSEWQSWSALYMLVSIGSRKPSLCWRTFSYTVLHNHYGSFPFPGEVLVAVFSILKDKAVKLSGQHVVSSQPPGLES